MLSGKKGMETYFCFSPLPYTVKTVFFFQQARMKQLCTYATITFKGENQQLLAISPLSMTSSSLSVICHTKLKLLLSAGQGGLST